MWFTREVAAPAEAAWEVLVDTEAWPRWGPPLSAVEADHRRIGPGSRGKVRTVVGLWLPFEVTVFDEGDEVRQWRWRVAGIPATGHGVRVLGPDRCRVGFDVPLPALPYGVICQVALDRIAAEVEPAATSGSR
jgi:uncharacterized protein YndB with AHSA1/START domain